MKKQHLCGVLFIVLWSLVSCDNSKLTSQKAMRLIENGDIICTHDILVELPVGKYVIDRSMHLKYPSLVTKTLRNPETNEKETIVSDICCFGGFGYGCIDCLTAFQKAGLITLEYTTTTGHLLGKCTEYHVNVKLTSEGEKYLVKRADRAGKEIVLLKGYKMKLHEIFELEVYPANNSAKCLYNYVYSNVSPFAELALGIKDNMLNDTKHNAKFKYYEEEGWKFINQ